MKTLTSLSYTCCLAFRENSFTYFSMGLFSVLRERSIFSQWEKAWILRLPGVQVSGEAIQRKIILKGDFPTRAHHGKEVSNFFFFLNGQYSSALCPSYIRGFPGVIVVKNLPANAWDASSIPGSGRSPGVGDGNLLQFSCLENSTDRSLTSCSLWDRKESEATEYTHISTHS